MTPEEAKEKVIKNRLFRDQLKSEIKTALLRKGLQQNELCVMYGEAKNKDGKAYDTGHINKLVNVWAGFEERAAELYEYIYQLP